jgi:hypothetical protein
VTERSAGLGKAVQLTSIVHQDATARRRIQDPFRSQIDEIAVIRHQAVVHVDVRPIGAPDQSLRRMRHQGERQRRDIGIRIFLPGAAHRS